MRCFLLVIPVFLLIVLTACVPEPSVPLAPTPGFGLFDTQSSNIFNYLNKALEDDIEFADKFDEVEHITGASYQVTHVAFLQDAENPRNAIFHVEIRCECATNGQCCSPTRTFVITLMALNDPNYQGSIRSEVQQVSIVEDMEVWTFDHAVLTDEMSVPWADVENFLQGTINGFQLAAKVVRIHMP